MTKGVVTSLKVATESASRRIARWAFQYARDRGRKKVTVMHKANIMKMTDGMYIRCAREVREEEGFTDIDYQEVIIDAGCMKLVQDPTQFDVLLLENLYGDVLSDLCAGFVGGLGVIPGANIGEDYAVFEAVHGSAPDIAGRGVANPLALLMSAVMMLNYLADTRGDEPSRLSAQRIKAAYDAALSDGKKTRDLGGELGTSEFADAVQREFKAIFADLEWKRIPPSHPVFTAQFKGFELDSVRIRRPPARAEDGSLQSQIDDVTPMLEGMELDGRFVVMFSPYDLSCALESSASTDCEGYLSEDAARIGTNVILYSLQQ